MPKVLIAVPYHEKKDYCLPQLLNSLKSLTYPTNLRDTVLRFHHGTYGEIDAVKKQRQFFADLALKGGFDYLYFHGADTIPPVDVIEKLMNRGKDIISGVYYGRSNAENGNINTAVAWKHGIDPIVMGERLLGKNEDLISIDGYGMDCVLIKRKILEKVNWKMWKVNDDDYPFCDQVKNLGIPLYIDTKVQCKHYFDKDKYVYMKKIFND